MYACLAVTCHLHFWQNDRDFLRATVVTRGWNRYRNKSQHRKSTLEKKILPPFQQGFEPATFQSWVRCSNHWAIPAPLLFKWWNLDLLLTLKGTFLFLCVCAHALWTRLFQQGCLHYASNNCNNNDKTIIFPHPRFNFCLHLFTKSCSCQLCKLTLKFDHWHWHLYLITDSLTSDHWHWHQHLITDIWTLILTLITDHQNLITDIWPLTLTPTCDQWHWLLTIETDIWSLFSPVSLQYMYACVCHSGLP